MFQSIATLRIDMFQSIATLHIDMFQSIATLHIDSVAIDCIRLKHISTYFCNEHIHVL